MTIPQGTMHSSLNISRNHKSRGLVLGPVLLNFIGYKFNLDKKRTGFPVLLDLVALALETIAKSSAPYRSFACVLAMRASR